MPSEKDQRQHDGITKPGTASPAAGPAAPATAPAAPIAAHRAAVEPPRVLVVDDEPAVVEAIRDALAGRVRCKVYSASTAGEARDILRCEGIELLVADVSLPDGDGTQLLADLRDLQPAAAAMVITGTATTERAVAALRGGAVDFVAKPFTAGQIVERVNRALVMQALRARRERRTLKLKDAVRRLNRARRTVGKKVDLLCNDLIGAYGELSKQLDQVRIQEGFRHFIEQGKGLEQLLCHTMDWLLRQVGYCNIGIWLSGNDSELQLGAFMKYTVAAEPELTEALQKNLLRVATRRGFVRLSAPEAKGVLTPAEMKHLSNQDVVAVHCTYLGETLGVVLLFRDHKTPFSDEDVAAVKTVCPLFALALARTVKGAPGGDADGADEEGPGAADAADSGEPSGPATAPPEEGHPKRPKGKSGKPKPPKRDPADWWKYGEAPPF